MTTCDECQTQFDIFKEGHASKYYSYWCGKCWAIEWKLRVSLGYVK